MKRVATAAATLGLALLTYFQFPGHTYLQQDTQIYVPILEHLRDPFVLRNDILAAQPHVAFTLYDEIALFSSGVTGLDFGVVLAIQQVISRAFGIWGLYLIAAALGLSRGGAFLVATICSLGATIVGPTVLLTEYEPTPRAFALPLILCAVGLVAHRRYVGAGMAAAVAFLYHAPTALPFWGLYGLLAICPGKPESRRRLFRGLAPLPAAVAILLMAAFRQGTSEAQSFFTHLTPLQEQVQRMRVPYVWISTWPRAWTIHYGILFVVLLAALARVRRAVSPELGTYLLGLPVLGMVSMPVSWLLVEHWKWALLPQLQPMRALMFVTLVMQLLASVAGVRAMVLRRPFEAAAWFVVAYLPPLQPLVAAPWAWRRAVVAAGLALLAAAAVWLSEHRGFRLAPLAGIAAFVAVPGFGGVVNYPQPYTPDLAQLSQWARTSTPKDAVFLFPDARRGVEPGIFRCRAQRAVYVDWKGGGQVNYLRDFVELWWFRWRQTMANRFKPGDFPRYEALGIDYVVLTPRSWLKRPAVFANSTYAAYRIR